MNAKDFVDLCVRVYEYTGGIGPRWKWDLNQIEKPKMLRFFFKLYNLKASGILSFLGMVT